MPSTIYIYSIFSNPLTRKALFLLLLLLFGVRPIYSQSVLLRDKGDGSVVPNVFIYDSDQARSVMSDSRGKADLSLFNEGDILVFQHPAYHTIQRSYRELLDNDWVIKLEGRTIDLDKLTITATSWRQSRDEVPNRIISLDPEQLSFYNPQTTADMLSSSNEVFVQKSQLGGGSPMLRGFSANSVLLVVDGVRMNNAIFRSGNLQNVISIDPNMLDDSEVILGPGSVIYGSDALGGVMAFHTLNPQRGSAEKANISGQLLTRYSSANQERTVHSRINVGLENWAFLTGVTYSSFDHLRAGGSYPDHYPDFGKRTHYVKRIHGQDSLVANKDPNIQNPSAYHQLNLSQKVRYSANDHLNITYGFHHSQTSDIPRYDRLTEPSEAGLRFGEWYYGPQKWTMHNLVVNLRHITQLFDHGRVSVSYQDYLESRHDRRFQDHWLRNRTESVDAYQASLDLDKQLTGRSSLYYGGEAVWNRVVSTANRECINTSQTVVQAPRYPSGGSDYRTFAGYLFYRHKLHESLSIKGGVRYSRVNVRADFSGESLSFYELPFSHITLNTGAVNGLTGISWAPGENWDLSFSASSGFRAPNVDDLAKVFDSEPGSVVVPNKDLEPEYARNLEASVGYKAGPFLHMELTGFHTWLDNAMVRRNYHFNGKDSIMYDGRLSNVLAMVNESAAVIYGGSARATAQWGRGWSASANYTITLGQDQQGVPLRHVPPAFGNASITYNTGKIKGSFYVNYNNALEKHNMAPCEQAKTHMYTHDGSPAWHTLNAMFSWNIHRTAEVSFGCENILDRHYRPYSSGISAPGRNFILSLRLNLDNQSNQFFSDESQRATAGKK